MEGFAIHSRSCDQLGAVGGYGGRECGVKGVRCDGAGRVEEEEGQARSEGGRRRPKEAGWDARGTRGFGMLTPGENALGADEGASEWGMQQHSWRVTWACHARAGAIGRGRGRGARKDCAALDSVRVTLEFRRRLGGGWCRSRDVWLRLPWGPDIDAPCELQLILRRRFRLRRRVCRRHTRPCRRPLLRTLL